VRNSQGQRQIKLPRGFLNLSSLSHFSQRRSRHDSADSAASAHSAEIGGAGRTLAFCFAKRKPGAAFAAPGAILRLCRSMARAPRALSRFRRQYKKEQPCIAAKLFLRGCCITFRF